MKKNLFVSLFCIILAFTCILCGFNGINSELNNISEVTETPTEEPTTQIATTAPQIVTEEKVFSLASPEGMNTTVFGSLFGKGLGNSAQKMIIPEAQNDMILSIICEELGVFGIIIMLTLFGMLLYRLMFIAQNAPDLYGSLIVTGIFAHIAIQVIFNVAVVLNLFPTTGITLPFISYGGTSILFLMAEMGLALGVSRRIQLEE